ncbi:MAG: ABC transporter substrate-binding protein [Synechococcales cyanobacterium]
MTNPDSRYFKTCRKCGYERNPLQAKVCEICGAALGGLRVPPIVWIALAAALGMAGYQAWRRGMIPGIPSPVVNTPVAPVSVPTPPAASAPANNPASLPGTTAPATSTSQPAGFPNLGSLFRSEPTPGASTVTPSAAVGDISGALSQGERLLIAESTSPEKVAGTQAMTSQNWEEAVRQFSAARTPLRSDPETLIYLNNARLGAAPALEIAVVVPIGSSVNPAREILRGVAQMQERHNQNRGNALPLRVWIGDDGNDPARAQALAQAIVANPRILAVVGHGTSATSVAAAPIYRQGQKLMIAPTSTSTELAQTQSGSQNFIFRTIPSDQFTGTALARHLLGQNLRQVSVFFNSQSSYSRSLKDAFTTTLALEGGQVLQEVDLSQGDPPATNGSSQALVLLTDAQTFEAAMRVVQINNRRLPIFGGDALYRIDALQQGGAAINGMVVPIPWHPQKSGDPQFPRAAQQLWGGDVNWRTALAYDATLALTQALRQAPNPTSSVQLAAALTQSGFGVAGVTGMVSFTPTGERLGKVLLVRVQPGSLSKTGYDFVPL